MVTPRSTIVLALALSSLLVACEGSAPEPVASESAQGSEAGITEAADRPATAGVFPANGNLVEIPVDTSKREPLFLAENETLVADVSAPTTGTIQAVGIEIGNFEGASQGMVRVEVCQLEACAEGQAQLEGSVDNSYLPVILSTPLEVVGDQPLVLTLSRSIGNNPFAIWAYPATTMLTLPGGSEASQSPKLALSYRNP